MPSLDISISRRQSISLGLLGVISCATGSTVASSAEINTSFSFEQKDLESAFNDVFTKVIVFNNGVWKVNPSYRGEISGLTVEDARSFAQGMNSFEKGSSSSRLHRKPGAEQQGPKEFVTCVFKGMLPGSVIASMDWNAVYFWIKQRTWGKLSSYVMKHAVKYGVKDLAKFTPYGLAISLVATAAGCAFWG